MEKLVLLSGMLTLLCSLVKQGPSLTDHQAQQLSRLAVTSYQALYLAALEQDPETDTTSGSDVIKDDGVSQLTAMKTTECCLQMTGSVISVLPSNIAQNVQLVGVELSLAGFELVKKRGLADENVNMYKIDNCVAVAAPSFLSNLSTLLSEFNGDIDVQPSQPEFEKVHV